MKTQHKIDCKMSFGRKDKTCPRCIELLAGAAPRAGWNDQKIKDNANRAIAISQHYANHETCEYAKRNVPCVAFDY